LIITNESSITQNFSLENGESVHLLPKSHGVDASSTPIDDKHKDSEVLKNLSKVGYICVKVDTETPATPVGVVAENTSVEEVHNDNA